jgi:hypothetical protein
VNLISRCDFRLVQRRQRFLLRRVMPRSCDRATKLRSARDNWRAPRSSGPRSALVLVVNFDRDVTLRVDPAADYEAWEIVTPVGLFVGSPN